VQRRTRSQLGVAILAAAFAVAPGAAEAARCDGHRATVVGTGGKDRIRGTDHSDVIRARGGDDVVTALRGDDHVCAGKGDDTVSTGTGADTVLAGRGQGLIDTAGGRDVIAGDFATFSLIDSGDGADDVNAEALGSLSVETRGGNDEVFAGVSDLVTPGEPDVDAGEGDDFVLISMNSAPGVESAQGSGGAGDDTVIGGNLVEGGSGDDLLAPSSQPPNDPGDANDDPEVDGGTGADLIEGSKTQDELFGGDGADEISGREEADRIHGGDGFDQLFGGEGDDDLFGEPGDDLLSGDADTDDCDGGTGIDDENGTCEATNDIP
jgi:Ca2+-binding RTX toxin-like protein